MQIRRGLLACMAGALVVCGAPLQGREAPAQAPAPGAAAPAQPTTEQLDLGILSRVVDAVASGQRPSPPLVSLKWVDRHFIRSQGDTTYIPFTIAVDRSLLMTAPTALYVRVVDSNAKPPAAGERPAHPWDTIHFVNVPASGSLSRAIALPPGNYVVYVALKARGAGTTPGEAAPAVGLLRYPLTVPSFSAPDLNASSVILARSVSQLQASLPAEQQQDNPYTFGTLKITPALDAAFSTSGSLDLLFWIYNASHTAGKPDVQVDVQFHQVSPEGELKYYNKTLPQMLNATTLPAAFNLTAGHQLLSSQSITLKDFPVGAYRLEITVTDKPSGKTLVRFVDFTVSA